MTLDSRTKTVSHQEIQALLSVVETAPKHLRAVAIVQQELSEASTFERPAHRDWPGVLWFPPFRLDVAEARLWKGGRELRLRPKPFAILRYLAQHPRRLVTRSEIVEAVWGKVAMSESLLRTHVHDLRRVLGEHVIETVVGRGYRFAADVSEIAEARAGIGLPEKPALKVVGASQSRSPGPTADAVRAVRAADNARMLEELTGALTTLGVKAVLLFVGDEQGERIATLFGAASTEEQSVAVAPTGADRHDTPMRPNILPARRRPSARARPAPSRPPHSRRSRRTCLRSTSPRTSQAPPGSSSSP